ncbi:MAG: hypothetical protein MK212_01670, partial [Saprospiraceae bacterium]|nr:hypothetical protein [Saprospiraceae bacterium]
MLSNKSFHSIQLGDTIIVDTTNYLEHYGKVFSQLLGESGRVFCFEQDSTLCEVAKQKYSLMPTVHYYNNSLGNITRAKQVQIDAFLENLEALLERVDAGKEIYILGNVNIDFLKK